jgi:hypothetical protein
MTALVDIKPGQWVLAFYQPYGLYDDRPMTEHLEMFVRNAGGWDSHGTEEIFLIHEVEKGLPKTYIAADESRRVRRGERLYRVNIIAACSFEAEATALRDRFHAIGLAADDQIDFVVDRLAKPVRKRVYAKALKEVHACLPHIFGRGA